MGERRSKHLITARNLSRRKKNGDEETPPVMSSLRAAASIALFYTIPFCFYFARFLILIFKIPYHLPESSDTYSNQTEGHKHTEHVEEEEKAGCHSAFSSACFIQPLKYLRS